MDFCRCWGLCEPAGLQFGKPAEKCNCGFGDQKDFARRSTQLGEGSCTCQQMFQVFSLLSMLFFSSKTGLLAWKEDIKYGQREVQKYEEGIREVEAEIGKLKRRTYVEPMRS